MDIAATLGDLAGKLAKAGAPLLGGIIGTAIGGPAGAAIGGTLAGKAVDALAEAFKVPPTPEAVASAIEASPNPAAVLAPIEAAAPEMIRLWEIEARRASDAQAAEIEHGFTSWQVMRTAWQVLIIAGWGAILAVALVGGNLGARTLMPLPEVVSAWGSVTLAWLAVFNGGHVLKEIAPSIGFRRPGK